MANIVSRSPLFGKIARVDPFPNIDEWFKDFGLRPFSAEMEGAPAIKVDVTENDTAYTVRAEIPGVKKEDVKVQVDGNRISISAETKQEKEEKKDEKIICRECYQGSSFRSFSLANDVDESKAEAKYENGILELNLPKKTGKAAKHLEIK